MRGVGKVLLGRCLLVAVLVATAGCSSSKSNPSPSATNRQDPCSPSVTVLNRASTPTDESAQGLVFGPNGTLNVGVGPSAELRLTSQDWNTIDSASYVPVCVPLELDPVYSVQNRTTLNRFQYLADRLAAYPDSRDVKSFYVSQHRNGEALGVILAFWNQTDTLQRLYGLTIDISESPPDTPVVNAAIPDSQFAFVVQPRAIYIREVYVDKFQPAPSTATRTSVTVDVQHAPTAFGS